MTDELDKIGIILITAMTSYCYYYLRKHRRRPRRFWMRHYFLRRDTNNRGLLNDIENELLRKDSALYYKFMRVNETEFDYVLGFIVDDIQKMDTCMRKAISAKQRLSITLRYLATGETFASLSISCRISESAVRKIVKETLNAIVRRLGPIHLQVPSTPEEWLQVADEFTARWGFPNCVGALDGKHISFKASKKDGAFYYNYKGFHSIVLLALVDANKKFLYIDVGANGRTSDGGVFANSTLHDGLQLNTFNLPSSRPLPGRIMPVPFVVIADAAFPLLRRLLKPYIGHSLSDGQITFNKRLSSARNVVENAFGLLANRFRVFLSAIESSDPNFVDLVVKASCVLHNMLMERSPSIYGILDEDDTSSLPNFERDDDITDTGGSVRLEFYQFLNGI